MDMDAQGIAIIIGSIGGLVAAMLGVFYKITKDNSKERASTAKCNAELISKLTMVVQENSDVNKQVVESSNRVATATERSAQEAKERNGHLAELQLKSQKMIDRNFQSYQKINKQHVVNQEIDLQTIYHNKKTDNDK